MINLAKDKVQIYFIKTWVGNGWDICKYFQFFSELIKSWVGNGWDIWEAANTAIGTFGLIG